MNGPAEGLREATVLELASWLEAERSRLAAAWTEKGISPTVTISQPTARQSFTAMPPEIDGRRKVRAELSVLSEPVEVSRLRIMGDLQTVFGFETPAPIELLTSAYGPDFVLPPFADAQANDLQGRFKVFFGRLCGDYLRRLTTVSQGDPELARSIASEYLAFVESDDIFDIQSVLIGGIETPPVPIDTGRVALRPLSPEEYGQVLMDSTWGSMSLDKPTALLPWMRSQPNPEASICTSVLTLRERRPKYGKATSSHRMAQLVLALQLLEWEIAGTGAGLSWTEPGPSLGLFGFRLTIPVAPAGGPRHFAPLHEQDLNEALHLAGLIPPKCFDAPSQRSEVALHRFLLATAHGSDADSIIDYVIALEALLVPESKTESVLRFRLNGARYLEKDASERNELFADLGELYDVRSKLVHGGGTKQRDLGQLRRKARAFSGRGLIKALNANHWPTAKDFEVLALS